jgi:hypothetical protein
MDAKTRNNIKDLFLQAANLKAYLQLIELPAQRLESRLRKRRRSYFQKTAKDNFYKWLAHKHPNKLEIFGFDHYDIIKIAALGVRGIVESGKESLMPYNIDHIKPLSWGGTSKTGNLCLLPVWINLLKEDIEQAQLVQNPNRKTVHTLGPKFLNGKYDPVPYIPEKIVLRANLLPYQRAKLLKFS